MDTKAVLSLLVWDAPDYVSRLLANLQDVVPSANYRLHILDQGSDRETAALLDDFRQRHGNVLLTRLPENIGYPAGHNLGYRTLSQRARFKYFVTINSDVLFQSPFWLDALVDAMERDPSVAIGGPFGFKRQDQALVEAEEADMAAGNFVFLSGAVAAINTAVVERFGLFDEEYTPAYWEDADMAYRYVHYGLKQLHIGIPVAHAYLENHKRTNQEKSGELSAKYGSFIDRNRLTFKRRWLTGASYAHEKEEIRAAFPRLFIP